MMWLMGSGTGDRGDVAAVGGAAAGASGLFDAFVGYGIGLSGGGGLHV